MATDAVTMAICRKISAYSKLGSRARWRSRSCSRCSGLGSSTSGTARGRPLADLLPHRFLARLERGDQPLGLFLEQLTALVEPLAGLGLRITGQTLRPLGHVSAARDEQLARL